eukprot:Sdes_comp23330_c0_seq1m21600
MNRNLSKALENQLLHAAEIVEQQVDSELNRLDHLDETDLESIRKNRIEQLKKQAKNRENWKSQGHGKYTEIDGEREFFNVSKQSSHAVYHFYRNSTWRCKILDRHLFELAEKHLECRFVKINAEKSPFLCERLKITVLPTLILVKDGLTCGKIIGFDSLGGNDNFKTFVLAKQLSELINYEGDQYRDSQALNDNSDSDSDI